MKPLNTKSGLNNWTTPWTCSAFLFLITILQLLNAKAETGEENIYRGDNKDQIKVSVIIVGHGGIPNDFPDIKEYFTLHDKGGEKFEKIENELIHWARNENNDKYWAGFMKVVGEVEKSGDYHSVHAAFNEMCAPTVDEALEEAIKTNPDIIVLVSIMVTPGGGHSEQDIPASIEVFRSKNPDVKIVYAWPYEVSDISVFLTNQVNKFIREE